MRKLFNNFFKKSEEGRYSLFNSVNRQVSFSSVTPKQGLDFNEISLYLNKGINKRGEKIGETEFVLKKLNGDVIESHWILDLLDKPNETQTGDQFWKLASIYKDATGFVVIRKIGNGAIFSVNSKVKSLELLNSSCITINFSADGKDIQSFTYKNPISSEIETIPYDQCIYWYNPNPKNQLEGISIITAGIRSVSTELEMGIYQNSLLKNGGVVDSVLSFKNNLTTEQLKKIKNDYIKEYGETSKAGTPLILGGDAEYTKIALNPQELAFLESKNMIVDDITVITGVPKAILGLTSGETRANADTAHTIFLRETIRPLARDLVNVLDWRLLPADLELDFVDPTPEDVEIKLKTLEIADKVNALTVNEKREMLGLEPIKNGDEILVPFNKIPMEKGVFVHPLKNKDFRERYHKSFKKSLDNKKIIFKTKLNKYFKEQEKRVLDHLNIRKQVKVKTLADEMFDTELEIKLAFPLLETMKEIVKEEGQATMDLFNAGANYNYSTSVDTAVVNRFNFFARQINETTAKELQREVTEWLASEGTVSEMIERVKDVYTDIEEWRATTIANTEVASIMQEAKFDSYKQLGIKTKIWVWSPGIKGGVRDDHQAIDFEERPIDVPFSNGLMRPLDENADAGDVVNCECTI